MEIGSQENNPQQHHSSVSYKPFQDHDHTLACIRADVYELSPATCDSPAKWNLRCSSEPVSLCYDSYRFLYRALCLKGSEIIVNSCIMPDSKITKTAPLFCTWNDDRTKKFLGFGFKQEVLIDTFIKAFEDAKTNMEELLRHIVPINAMKQSYPPEQWQPIILNYSSVPVQSQKPQPDISTTVSSSSDTKRLASSAKSMNNNSIRTKSSTSRKVTAINSSDRKTANAPANTFEIRGQNPEIESRAQQQSKPNVDFVDPEMITMSQENIQLKQFLITSSEKIKVLETECQSLLRRNNVMQKSNEVLANNTNNLQTRCDEAEKQMKYWRELAEKSEMEQTDKLEESKTKRQNQLSAIFEQRDEIKSRSEQQQIEANELRTEEETLITKLEDLHAENKAVTVTERKMQDDRLLIKRLTEEQLKDSVELKNKIESTLQSLLETSVDIKNSIKKTAFIIDQNNNDTK